MMSFNNLSRIVLVLLFSTSNLLANEGKTAQQSIEDAFNRLKIDTEVSMELEKKRAEKRDLGEQYAEAVLQIEIFKKVNETSENRTKYEQFVLDFYELDSDIIQYISTATQTSVTFATATVAMMAIAKKQGRLSQLNRWTFRAVAMLIGVDAGMEITDIQSNTELSFVSDLLYKNYFEKREDLFKELTAMNEERLLDWYLAHIENLIQIETSFERVSEEVNMLLIK
ncbi:MAG: hypothetical protein AB8E15_08880 [Bdellovibrionales bacterium]